MVFRITLISDEIDDFVREYKIDADATFFDLHRVIQASCQYQEREITSFFVCNEDWEKEQEIILEDMGTSGVDEDIYLMKETRLGDLLEDEKQRMMYVFDPLSERLFFMELTEIIFGEAQSEAICTRGHGNPPAQFLSLSEETAIQDAQKKNLDIEEDFYGSEDFADEEFDPEGMEISEGKPY